MSSMSLSSGKKKKKKDEKVQYEKFQSSAHEVLNQPLQDYSSFLRKEIYVNPHRKSILRDWKEQKQGRKTSPSLTWIKNQRRD